MTAFPKPIKRKRVRKPLRRRSARMEANMDLYLPAREMFLKKNPECLACKLRGLKPKRATDVHHVRGRARPLLMDERYWASVDRACHNWIGENPLTARILGLICGPGQWNQQPKP